VWLQDEGRFGQKGRTAHRWWTKGERAPGLCDRRFTFAYMYAAVRPGTDQAFALVASAVGTEVMSAFLAKFAETLEPDEHALMVMDRAGWHGAGALEIPGNVTLCFLPPYAPELNPVERVWLYIKERYLSHRLLDDYEAVEDAVCKAWNRLCDEAGRLTSLTDYAWIRCVIS
jgi:transposase